MNDQYLIDLVNAGKSLRTIRGLIKCGPKFTLKKLKRLGLADKSLTVEDCKVPGWGDHYKQIQELFTYDDFLKYIIKENIPVKRIAKRLNVNRDNLRYAIKKYKTRYQRETETSV
jgi:hypothetical protein